MAGLNNNNNPFQSQVRIGPNYIQLVPGPPGPPGTIGLTGTGLVHVTSGSVDNAAYLGAAGSIPIVNAGGTDTAWLAIGTAGQVLTVVGSAPTWAAAPSGVTWANDLSSSSNTHQYVSAISGANGTAGNVTLGDGTHNLTLDMGASAGAVSPFVRLNGAAGIASGSSTGGYVTFVAGPGSAAAAGNNTGGAGGGCFLIGGTGGTSTGTAANSNGGSIGITGGGAGTGGSGAAGVPGNVTLTSGVVVAFATANAAGPGFGIGTTPGTDPTLTRGTGVPATTQTNGSLFLRTDGSSGSNGLYTRQGGVWYSIATTWANDLATSTNVAQWVSGISGGSGTAGTVTLGDGVHNLSLSMVASAQITAPALIMTAALGFTGSGTGGPGGIGTSSGGTGGAATAGNHTGGAGGYWLVLGGTGGTSTGTAANANGGNAALSGGAAGTGGSGAAGLPGNALISSGNTVAFGTSALAGPGFGIGTTPGVDPTLTRGTGVPATTQTNGSLFLRTDGSGGANALYAMQGGTWFPVGGTSTTGATLTFEGQAFQLAAAGSGNGTILWPVGQATPTITQTILASDVTPANIAITAQSAQPGAATHLTGGNLVFTSGTGATTNGTPGTIIFNTPAATGSGTNGQFQFQRGGVPSLKLWDNGTYGPSLESTGISLVGLYQLQGIGANAVYFNIGQTNVGLHFRDSGFGEFANFSATGIQLCASAPSFGGGSLVVGLGNATTAPTSNPSGGGVLYERPTGNIFAGTLTHRGLGGSIQEIAAPGAGTINTQLATQRKITSYYRTTNSTTVTAYVYTMPAGTGNTAMLDVIAVGKDVTNAGNITMHRVIRPYWNNAGTATAVGAQTTVYNGGAGGGNLSLGTGSGLTIPIQLNGQSQTEDWEITIIAYEN